MARGSKWGRKEHARPEGHIRQSQVVTTFGPGAMVDLVDQAVVVGGLDFWSYDPSQRFEHIVEPRLRDAIAKHHRELSRDEAFREPPVGNDREPSRGSGVQVLEMPQWFVCQNPRCRALVKSGPGLELKRGRYVHQCERTRAAEAVPVRFVAACRRGHLEEWDWIRFVHRGGERCAAPSLRLFEGATGDFSEIRVVCACGETQPLSGALARESNPYCNGERPWLGREGKEECDERVRLLVRTASNSYFPQVMSALSVPDEGGELAEAVEREWKVLKAATAETLPAFRTIPSVKIALADYADAEVLAAVRARAEDRPLERKPLRTAEYEQFLAQPDEAPGDLAKAEELFFGRAYVPDDGLPPQVSTIVLAHKLREVRVQVGFTRIEPVTPDLQGEFDLGVTSQRLGLNRAWLPASEVRGEGVFVRLDEHAVREWERRAEVIERGKALLSGYDAWAAGYETAPPFPGVRFYMLHSLAHLLVNAISLECGYSASAIRERIYCAASDAEVPMAAILLSTGSSGTEGTLGGLVEQGRRLREHLRHAFDLGTLCSNDPVCGAHSPEGDRAERFLEGAACHGCMFVAECSCERFNRYLDRALVVPTINRAPELAFFGERP